MILSILIESLMWSRGTSSPARSGLVNTGVEFEFLLCCSRTISFSAVNQYSFPWLSSKHAPLMITLEKKRWRHGLQVDPSPPNKVRDGLERTQLRIEIKEIKDVDDLELKSSGNMTCK